MSKKIIPNKIDFLGIGAQKSGTTWLYHRLSELPEFSFPPLKELHYFDRSKDYPSPNKLAETHLINRLKKRYWLKSATLSTAKELASFNIDRFKWFYKWYFSNYNDDWYLSLFDSLQGIRGEISPSYSILSEEDVKKMHALLPNIKIIFLIRNPIERAWSHYRFSLTYEHTESHEANSIKDIINFMDSNSQELRSNYIRTFETFSKYYSTNQILIGFYDAIKDKPEDLISDIVLFLGGTKSKIISQCNINRKSNISPKLTMPDEVKHFLKVKYRPVMKELSDKFGSYCSKWYQDLYNSDDKNDSSIILDPTLIKLTKTNQCNSLNKSM